MRLHVPTRDVALVRVLSRGPPGVACTLSAVDTVSDRRLGVSSLSQGSPPYFVFPAHLFEEVDEAAIVPSSECVPASPPLLFFRLVGATVAGGVADAGELSWVPPERTTLSDTLATAQSAVTDARGVGESTSRITNFSSSASVIAVAVAVTVAFFVRQLVPRLWPSNAVMHAPVTLVHSPCPPERPARSTDPSEYPPPRPYQKQEQHVLVSLKVVNHASRTSSHGSSAAASGEDNAAPNTSASDGPFSPVSDATQLLAPVHKARSQSELGKAAAAVSAMLDAKPSASSLLRSRVNSWSSQASTATSADAMLRAEDGGGDDDPSAIMSAPPAALVARVRDDESERTTAKLKATSASTPAANPLWRAGRQAPTQVPMSSPPPQASVFGDAAGAVGDQRLREQDWRRVSERARGLTSSSATGAAMKAARRLRHKDCLASATNTAGHAREGGCDMAALQLLTKMEAIWRHEALVREVLALATANEAAVTKNASLPKTGATAAVSRAVVSRASFSDAQDAVTIGQSAATSDAGDNLAESIPESVVPARTAPELANLGASAAAVRMAQAQGPAMPKLCARALLSSTPSAVSIERHEQTLATSAKLRSPHEPAFVSALAEPAVVKSESVAQTNLTAVTSSLSSRKSLSGSLVLPETGATKEITKTRASNSVAALVQRFTR